MALTLAGLPAEVIDNIAWYIELDCLHPSPRVGNLRLACRALAEKTEFRFGTTYFHTATVIVSPKAFPETPETVHLIPRFWRYVRELGVNCKSITPQIGHHEGRGRFSATFDPDVLKFIHGGGFEENLRRRLLLIANLEDITIVQPHKAHELSRRQRKRFRSAIVAIIKAVICVIRMNQIHLKLFSNASLQEDAFGIGSAAFCSIANPPELLNFMTTLRLHINHTQGNLENNVLYIPTEQTN